MEALHSRRTYDYRIQEAICESGDRDLFPELNIPRSTITSWIHRGTTDVDSCDFAGGVGKTALPGFVWVLEVFFSAFWSRERPIGTGFGFEEQRPLVGTIWGYKIELCTRGSWGSKIHGE